MSKIKIRKLLPLYLSVFIVGFTALSAQIVFLRELLVLFYGNELSLGVALGCWLFWTGGGSLLLGRFADRFRDPSLQFALFQSLLAISLVLTLLAVRSVKLFLNLSPGQIIGYVPIFAASFTVLSLFCLLNGFLFSLGCKAYERIAGRTGDPESGEKGSRGIGLIYIIEAAGAVIGGLLTSLVLIRIFTPFFLLFSLGLLNLGGGGWLILAGSGRRRFMAAKALWLPATAVWVFLAFGPGVRSLEKRSLAWQWKGFDLKKTVNSVYGNLAVTGRDGQFSLFENGILNFTRPDLFSAEEAVHFALLEHPRPETVLLIGGGMGGALEEILKYPTLREVVYLELDPAVIRLTEEFLPPGEGRFLDDPRVKVVYRDGRLFLRETGRQYDVIIVNLPVPFTAQLNRFYTEEFYRLSRERLKPGGVIGFGITSSENYISGELQNFIGSLDKTLRAVFPAVVAVPGGSNYFIASDRPDYLTESPEVLEERIRKRGLELKYIRSYYLADRMRPERVAYLRRMLETAPRARINRDFSPISYYYDMVFWSTYFIGETGGWFTRFLQDALVLRWWWFLFPPGLSLLLYPFLRAGRKKSRGGWVLWPVMTSGFSEIVFQVVVLLAFQIFYGYVYYKLGVILSLFMVGLVLGGAVITRRLDRIKDEHRLFLITQVAICLYPLALPVIFSILAAHPIGGVGENVIFPFLPMIAGFIGGFQFPLAGGIYLKQRKRVGLVSGLTYGFDLLGACLGALLVSVIVLPILGVFLTCLAVALLNFASLIVILAYR